MIGAIVAMTADGVIGRDGKLPWPYDTEDMAHFKLNTMGRPVIMGRKTAESLKGPLPGRHNWVLTRNTDWERDGFYPFRNVGELDAFSCGWIIGGAEIYRATIPWWRCLWITTIEGEWEGDTYFPGYGPNAITGMDMKDWQIVSQAGRSKLWVKNA